MQAADVGITMMTQYIMCSMTERVMERRGHIFIFYSIATLLYADTTTMIAADDSTTMMMSHGNMTSGDSGHIDSGHNHGPMITADENTTMMMPHDNDPGHMHTDHMDNGHTDPGHMDHEHTDPGHMDHGHTDPGHMDHGHTDQGHMDHGHTDPGHMDHGHTDPGHMDHGHTDSGHMDHGHTDPGHGGHDSGTGHVMDHGDDTAQHGSGGHGEFFLFSNRATILFSEWVTNDETFIPSCVGTALISAFYEGFKVLREYLMVKSRNRYTEKSGCCTGFCAMMHLLQTVLHTIQVAISFGIMLIFMTLNAWLCISILLGACFGYLVFGWTLYTKHAVSRFEHCH